MLRMDRTRYKICSETEPKPKPEFAETGTGSDQPPVHLYRTVLSAVVRCRHLIIVTLLHLCTEVLVEEG